MAAYAFSRIQWPGRDKVFLFYLGTLMVPGVVLMVLNFVVILGLGMFDDYTGLIIPAAFSAYGTFPAPSVHADDPEFAGRGRRH